MRIDIKGHGYRAIMRAAETIRQSRPFIVSEFSSGRLQANSGMPPVSYLDLLRLYGYRISVLDGRVLPRTWRFSSSPAASTTSTFLRSQ